jgi:hypothetical protein
MSTIDDLEKMLKEDENTNVTINPDGTISNFSSLVDRLRAEDAKCLPATAGPRTLYFEAACEIERLELAYAAETGRLRSILIEANNSWRHEFEDKVAQAAEQLFKRLSARNTDPFGRKRAEAAGGPIIGDPQEPPDVP